MGKTKEERKRDFEEIRRIIEEHIRALNEFKEADYGLLKALNGLEAALEKEEEAK